MEEYKGIALLSTSTMEKEHYEPSPEEMTNAERSMTGGQELFSIEREKRVRVFEERGVSGFLEKYDGDDLGKPCHILEGELNGQRVRIGRNQVGVNYKMGPDYGKPEYRYYGMVGNQSLTESDAEQLMNAYDRYAEDRNFLYEVQKNAFSHMQRGLSGLQESAKLVLHDRIYALNAKYKKGDREYSETVPRPTEEERGMEQMSETQKEVSELREKLSQGLLEQGYMGHVELARKGDGDEEGLYPYVIRGVLNRHKIELSWLDYFDAPYTQMMSDKSSESTYHAKGKVDDEKLSGRDARTLILKLRHLAYFENDKRDVAARSELRQRPSEASKAAKAEQSQFEEASARIMQGLLPNKQATTKRRKDAE